MYVAITSDYIVCILMTSVCNVCVCVCVCSYDENLRLLDTLQVAVVCVCVCVCSYDECNVCV